MTILTKDQVIIKHNQKKIWYLQINHQIFHHSKAIMESAYSQVNQVLKKHQITKHKNKSQNRMQGKKAKNDFIFI
jgi:hypothetical protein